MMKMKMVPKGGYALAATKKMPAHPAAKSTGVAKGKPKTSGTPSKTGKVKSKYNPHNGSKLPKVGQDFY